MIFRWTTKEAVFKDLYKHIFASWFTTKGLDWGVILVLFWCWPRKFFFSEMQLLNNNEHEVPSLEAAIHCKKLDPSGYMDSIFKVDRGCDVISRGNTWWSPQTLWHADSSIRASRITMFGKTRSCVFNVCRVASRSNSPLINIRCIIFQLLG